MQSNRNIQNNLLAVRIHVHLGGTYLLKYSYMYSVSYSTSTWGNPSPRSPNADTCFRGTAPRSPMRPPAKARRWIHSFVGVGFLQRGRRSCFAWPTSEKGPGNKESLVCPFVWLEEGNLFAPSVGAQLVKIFDTVLCHWL